MPTGMSAGASLQGPKYTTVEEIKAFRVEVDALIQKAATLELPYNLKLGDRAGAKLRDMCTYEVFSALTEAKMWLGKCLEAIGNPFPAELADKAPAQGLVPPPTTA